MLFLAHSPTPDRRVLVLSAEADSLVRDGAKGVWIDVAFEGEWRGHPSGAFQLTAETFERIVANHAANPNKVPLDYEHASERGGEAPAAGWVDAFELRHDDDGRLHLWAHAELTDKAVKQIDAGEYRYSSGVFDFAAVDFVTGEPIGCEMPSVALTNQPFIRGAEPIRLTAKKLMGAGSMDIEIAKLAKALKSLEGDKVTLEQLQALMTLHATGGGDAADAAAATEASAEPAEPVATTAPTPAPASEQVPAEPVEANSDMLEEEAASAAAGGGAVDALAMASTPEEVQAALEAFGAELLAMLGGDAPAEQEPAGEMALSAQRMAELQLKAVTAQRDALLAAQVERERADAVALSAKANEEVELLVASGVVLDAAERADLRRLYLTSPDSFRRMAGMLKPTVPVGVHASAIQPPTAATPSVPPEHAAEINDLRRRLTARKVPATKIEEKVRERLALRAGGAA